MTATTPAAQPTADPEAYGRVLIVDDLEDLRVLLRLQLLSRRHVEVVGEAADGLQAVQQCTDLQPDLVFLDVNLPHLSGLDALPQMRAGSPGSRIVMLSSHVDEQIKQAALRGGADRYIDKADGRRAVLAAIDELLAPAS